MNTAIYLRKSRAEEISDTTEETLHRHKETLLSFAKAQKLDIIKIYEEVISGENLYTRTEMMKLLADVERGAYNAVLCMDIDRLGRGSMSQQGIILEALKEANVKIITPRKTYDLNNEMDEEYTEFQTFFARRELKTIKRRMRQGITKTAQEGGYIANAPFGYEKCKVGKLPSLSIIEAEADFVRLIFDLYIQGNGCYTIAETLNNLGAVPKRGAKFSRTTIREIIKNPVYIGKIVYNRRKHRRSNQKQTDKWSTLNDESEWIFSNGVHKSIVDTETFEQANEILSEKYHPPSFKGTLTNPLAGLITCSKCGGKMIRRGFNHGDIIYLLCPQKGCMKSAGFDAVEVAFFGSIKTQLQKLKARAYSTDTEYVKDTSSLQALAAAKKEITTCKAQMEKLHDLLEQGVYTPDVFIERKTALEAKTKKLDIIVKDLESKTVGDEREKLKEICKRIETTLEAYSSAMIDEKNALLKKIVASASYFCEKGSKQNQFILTVKLKET